MKIISMSSLCLLLSFLFLQSCATTTPGSLIEAGSKQLSVYGGYDTSYSEGSIKLYRFAITNHTNEWIELKAAKIQAPEDVKILLGDKLRAWISSCDLQNQVSSHNRQLLFATVAVAASAAAVSSKSMSAVETNALVSLGAMTAGVTDALLDEKYRVEFMKMIPESHVLRPSVIPPGKVSQIWVLVENPQSSPLHIQYKTSQNEDLKITIDQTVYYL